MSIFQKIINPAKDKGEKHWIDELKIGILTVIVSLYYKPIQILNKGKLIRPQADVKGPIIYALWHGWLYAIFNLEDKDNINLLISPSNDGEFIARTAKFIGFPSHIRGSIKRDGAKAVRQILKGFKQGKSMMYTVDGPKGPIFKVKEGIIKIAQISGRPIIPVGAACSARFKAKSWDEYQVCIPGAKTVTVLGEPFYVPREAKDLEPYCKALEAEMQKAREEALEIYKK